MNKSGAVRRALDLFYNACGVLAGLSLIGITAFVMLQIVARPLGMVFTWTSEYAGYAGLIAANGGLAPNPSSVFAKHGFQVKLTISGLPR